MKTKKTALRLLIPILAILSTMTTAGLSIRHVSISHKQINSTAPKKAQLEIFPNSEFQQ